MILSKDRLCCMCMLAIACLGLACAGHLMDLSGLCCTETEDHPARQSAFDTGSCWMLVLGSCWALQVVFSTH